ncbi:MAG: hypothetical protein Q4A61_03470 [Porphyromonadaceae bacterium]|nr:hypothetical protein [Porphyromonadaceae bacterium]
MSTTMSLTAETATITPLTAQDPEAFLAALGISIHTLHAIVEEEFYDMPCDEYYRNASFEYTPLPLEPYGFLYFEGSVSRDEDGETLADLQVHICLEDGTELEGAIDLYHEWTEGGAAYQDDSDPYYWYGSMPLFA